MGLRGKAAAQFDSAPAADALVRVVGLPRPGADTAPAGDSTSGSTSGGTTRSQADSAPATDTNARGAFHPRKVYDGNRTNMAYVYYPNQGAGLAGDAATYLSQNGWAVTLNQADTAPVLGDLTGYRLFVVDMGYSNVPAAMLDLAYAAYQAGINVYITGNDTQFSPGCPIWTGVTFGVQNDFRPTNPVTASGHPLASGWVSYDNGSDDSRFVTGIRGTATVVATYTRISTGTEVPAMLVETDPNGSGSQFVFAQVWIKSAALKQVIAQYLLASPLDTATATSAHPRALADTAPAVDVDTRTAGHPRATADTAPAVDTTAPPRIGRLRAITTAVGGSDTLARLVRLIRGTTDAAPAVDSLSSVVGKLVIHVLGFLETVRRVLFGEAPSTVSITWATQDQQLITYADTQRPVTYTPGPSPVSFPEVTMHLSRQGVERYQPGPITNPAIDPATWSASFDGGVTWVASAVINSAPTWLVAGPSVSSLPGGATRLPDTAWVVPALKFTNGSETVIRDESFDDDQRPPAIYLV